LVEIGQMRNSDSLDEWYEKVLSFERLRREAIEEMIEEGEKMLFINLEEEAWRREELNI